MQEHLKIMGKAPPFNRLTLIALEGLVDFDVTCTSSIPTAIEMAVYKRQLCRELSESIIVLGRLKITNDTVQIVLCLMQLL